MREYFKSDEFLIIEEGFEPSYNRVSESVMSLGNGHMGIRGNFEEKYTGDSLSGSYYAGIYYPDKTKVGWWKNGYPEWFAKVLNGINYIGIDVTINGLELDIAKCDVVNFTRVLNMKQGYLERSFVAIDKNNNKTKIVSKRFLSMADSHIAAIKYTVVPLNYKGEITLQPYLNGKVVNEDSNYDEYFWEEIDKKADDQVCYLNMETKKLGFRVACAMKYSLYNKDKEIVPKESNSVCQENYVADEMKISVEVGDEITLNKYISAVTNRDYSNEQLEDVSIKEVTNAYDRGYETLFEAHISRWDDKWKENDITIKGDVKAQQGIRFNIFHLNQTYTGDDPRLNIGPKGFTGEKYGGSTYWDTEAYCLPFYLSTASSDIARNLLIYRYNHLEKAKENARKLGFNGALYPMVTMNGEECHNEWEITFEEIHRNGAIAYAIYNYVNYTGDKKYLADYGVEVLVEISRFWADRVNFNKAKDKYMILGVTGPNEYENNVNNNWYTNTIASWTLEYTLGVLDYIKNDYSTIYDRLLSKLEVKANEVDKWKDIVNKMYYPYIEDKKVFSQQDGYMDKEQILVKDLPEGNLPINKNWSWDRILRSCFIKQADVLQGIYLFNDRYDIDTIKRNFDFYEPRTVHESSLSPCIYSIIASQLGYEEKAYELYLRTARLDIDNYNCDSDDGLHITSMAGTWMSVVYGFGGFRVKHDELYLSPFIPKSWNEFSFRVMFRDSLLNIKVSDSIVIELISGADIVVNVFNKKYNLTKENKVEIENN